MLILIIFNPILEYSNYCNYNNWELIVIIIFIKYLVPIRLTPMAGWRTQDDKNNTFRSDTILYKVIVICTTYWLCILKKLLNQRFHEASRFQKCNKFTGDYGNDGNKYTHNSHHFQWISFTQIDNQIFRGKPCLSLFCN